MNNRIENLAQGCFEHIEGTLDGDIVEFDYKKFAELIVRECLHNMENCDGDLNFAIWKTKKEFGVE